MKAFIKATNFIEDPAIFTAEKDYYLTIIKSFLKRPQRMF